MPVPFDQQRNRVGCRAVLNNSGAAPGHEFCKPGVKAQRLEDCMVGAVAVGRLELAASSFEIQPSLVLNAI